MTKTLQERLRDSTAELGKASAGLARQASRVSPEVNEHFQTVIAFAADVEHWIGMIEARAAARALLERLEERADKHDLVELGSLRIKYQHVRLIGVQAYLATNWALADRLAGMVGRVFCTPDAGFDLSRPAQLVQHFVQKDRKKNTAGALYESVRHTFGWPIALSYALRNHFVHEGGQLAGIDFFAGPTASARFTITTDGWARVEDRAKTYGVEPSHHRAGSSWPSVPQDDLRIVLDACERETDDALGVLVGSACRSLVAHVGCILGED
jgi:hypothetical protein